ncbi:hypothetical protein V2J09_023023 [Rumex salicifolius]
MAVGRSQSIRSWEALGITLLLVSVDSQLAVFTCQIRSVTTQVKAPPQVRQGGAMQVSMLSPGIVYEPYTPREKIPFWKRWFTRSGWHRTKEDLILEISLLLANGDKTSLRKHVTEKMFSVSCSCFMLKIALKNEIKQRESVWNEVYWELIEPAIGVDKSNLNKVFVQLTLEFLTKQKFEAYNSSGAVVAGDKNKEVLVRDIWVFEKSLFHKGAYWRLCGRISL